MNRVIAPRLDVPNRDDAALLVQARAGDSRAREALIARYLDDVYALTTRMLGDPDRGADAAQDAFVNALRGLDAFRGESSFRTWLLRIAANAARTMMRRSGRRRETPLELAEPALADGAADPETRAVMNDDAQRALQLLAQLPPRQRQVVTLRVTEGLDYREIGRIVGCSETAARVNYHHGMKRLRELMQ
ncbi:MAG: RNA polymerase sigma factor [Candidatus Cloacimonetes bacterium]|nr:RNA polymerase sigma factor [Candidatus Cloacimonadota bacterium]